MTDVFNTSTLRGSQRVSFGQGQGGSGTLWTSGLGPPTDMGATAGSRYLDITNQRVFVKQSGATSGTWDVESGLGTVLYGTTVPANTLGNDLDTYLRLDVNNVVIESYKKTAGVWVVVGAVNPAWQTFSTVVTAESGTIASLGTVNMRFRIIGTVCFIFASVQINAAGTGAGALKLTLPVDVIVTGASASGIYSTSGVAITGIVLSPGNLLLYKYDGTTCIASGKVVICSAIYETA